MRLILAVIGLASAAVAQQEFIPIGGGSGISRQGASRQTEFGESFTPTIIDPNDPSFQPSNLPGNRPNPIPLFPKTQQAGTPHESPVDFTFVHQHSYKEPFRNDQFIGILHNPVGAARPNIPRTLGRENIWIDPRTIANSEAAKAELAKRSKSMIFYGLAPPVEKLHRADEFVPSTVPFQKPWDQWYDRFTEAPVLPRRQSLLTQTKRPTMVDIPFYAADRGKRQADTSTTAADETTTPAPVTTTILSDAIGSSTAVAALESTTTAAAAVIGTTTSIEADLTTSTTTTTPSPVTTTAAAATTTVATGAATNNTPSVTVSSTTTASSSTAKPVNQTSPEVAAVAASLDVVSAPKEHRTMNDTVKPVTTVDPNVPSSGPSIPFRIRNRRPLNSTRPTTVVQKLRALRTKVPLRTTLAAGNTTTSAPTTAKHLIAALKLESAVGAAKNSSRAATTKLPIRTTTLQRRPTGKTRVPLRRLLNSTTSVAHKSTTTTKTTTNSPSTTTPTTTPSPVISTLKALNRTNATTIARTKAPFRIFSKRPLVASKLPARTPIQEEPKVSLIQTNNVGELRTEVNRLLTSVVQLQSTVIAQQQRIALLENQLRLRRATGRKAAGKKTTRFIAPNGRMVERTTVDVRKGRSAKLRNGLSQVNLRQKSSLA